MRDVYLVTSRDGIKWDLSSIYRDEPLIQRGREKEWDNDQVRREKKRMCRTGAIAHIGGQPLLSPWQIMAAPSLITWKGEHWIYYLGINERHDCDSPAKRKAIGVAKLPLDRFASLRHLANRFVGRCSGRLDFPMIVLQSDDRA